MASRTFDITVNHVMYDDNRSHNEAVDGLGVEGGSDKARIFLKFDTNWSGMQSITSANLHIKTGPINTGADIDIKGVTAGWSASGMTWANQPGTTLSHVVSCTGTNDWKSYSITSLIERIAPTNIGGSGADNDGIRISLDNEALSELISFYSIQMAGNEPYITVVYDPNDTPDAPTLNSPDTNEVVNDTTPDFNFTHNDDGAIDKYRLQIRVAGSPTDWSDLVWDSGWTSTTDETPTVTSGVTLTRGTKYYFRARTQDLQGAQGPYTSGRPFFIAALPTASVTSPGTDTIAPLYYTAGTDTVPKLKPTWSFSCSDGGTQTGASVKVYDEAGTSLLHTHAHSGSATTAEISGYSPTNGTKYQISVTPTCSHGATGSESSKKRCRVRFGRAAYRADLGSAPVSLSVTVASTLNSGQIIMEYASSSGTTPEPTDWKADIAEVTKQRYIWHRVTMWGSIVAAPTSPQLLSVIFNYSALSLTPDNWTLASIASIDVGTYVYGTQSIKHAGDGTSKVTTQVVPVVPDTDYVLSGRIKTQGAAAASIELYDAAGAGVVANVAATTDTDWTRYQTAVWNSGSNSEITVRLRTQGSTNAWFDALKLEASTVVTPWTPGFLGQAVTLDSGGIGIDGVAGGVFRLRGSTGGTYDTVKLGTRGLNFGDVQVYGSATGKITVSGDLFANNNRVLGYAIDATDNAFTTEETVASVSSVTVAASRLIRITGHVAINPSAAGQATIRLKQAGTQVGFWKEQFASGNSADNKGTTVTTIVSSGAGGSFTYTMTAEGSVSMSADGSTIAPTTLLVEDLGPV